MVELDQSQIDALMRIHNGSVCCGRVGSGKSRVGLAYYYISEGGKLEDEILPTENPRDLYIITTAKKRNDREWETELVPFLMSTDPENDIYNHKIIVDSWNNVQKYAGVVDAFFIFDEQRVVGTGKWTKAFLKIVKKNHWIMLSATPGDEWKDYIPLFVANGFIRNKSEFNQNFVIFSPYCNYPKIDRYINESVLEQMRDSILVWINWTNPATRHDIPVWVDYDAVEFKRMMRERCDEEGEPFINAAVLCYELRKITNSHPSRLKAVEEIVYEKERAIIFYNFDYELEILRSGNYRTKNGPCAVAEWNGHKHESIPKEDDWVYLVQYTAGAEGWNCIRTDTIIFYSQTYSYKVYEQAHGRIDRRNTMYNDLWYYNLKSRSKMDLAIAQRLKEKRNFNERAFL